MKRNKINGVWLGKKKIKLNEKTIFISVYIDDVSEFCMVKGKRINLFCKNKSWVIK